ncbi:threonine--tRNA ligase [Candidatus Gracilibacteria bacterium GN02-873]|nr:threonine--tRNA ligase [Candidatus Gracilibacteria bacterium GN02-873]
MDLATKKHSLAHIMAQAVKEHFPDAKLGIGPATDDGFYYDFDFGDAVITENDLKKIEKSMKKILSQKQKFIHFHVSYDEAREILKVMNEEFKNILIDRFESGNFKNEEKLESGTIGFSINTSKGKSSEYYAKIQEFLKEKSFYDFTELDGDQVKNLKFIDMCAGPHIDSTADIDPNSFALARIAGAYWLGDAKNQQLTRIYAYAFETAEELDSHLKMLEEAKKRDHRILGKKMKLFTISDLVGSGLPLIQPRGMIMRKAIEDYLWSLHADKGYDRIWTPHLAKEDLYITSGHAGHYLEDMFSVWGGTSQEKFYVKPMNCPHHMQLFADNQFSYRDMPIRYFEPATVYRDEKTGQLSGLTRVRSITQDDGHLFCRVTQIKDEVSTIVGIIKEFYKTFGLLDGYWVSLSVRDPENLEKYLGDENVWQTAEKALEDAAEANSLNYKRMEGEAAFYGPKLDFMFKDAIGREWQLATIQCDFNLPNRFELSFKNEEGQEERPVVIHRAISGSLERFMGIMIEHFAGVFPLWIAPEQVRIVPVGEAFVEYAEDVFVEIKKHGIRVKLDDSSDSLSKKIRNAETAHVNYILVVGEQEKNSGTLAVRNYKTKEQTNESIADFVARIQQETNEKAL